LERHFDTVVGIDVREHIDASAFTKRKLSLVRRSAAPATKVRILQT
jgi:hypothetical protein